MQLEDYFIFLTPNDIRLKGTRVGIETILYDFIHKSRTPDQIVTSYPSLRLEQVYATITYYLHDKQEVDRYLTEWLEESRRRREEQRRNPPPEILRLRRLLEEQKLGQDLQGFRKP